MFLLRKISCTACKYCENRDTDTIVTCNFDKCKVRNNYANVYDSTDGTTETVDIDTFRGYLNSLEVENVSKYDNRLVIQRHLRSR